MKKLEIEMIVYPSQFDGTPEALFYKVGRDGITGIYRFEKKGPYDHESWFRIRAGDEIVSEIKESICSIYYKRENQ